MRTQLLAPVWNASERRLRTPWRLVLVGVALALAVAGLGVLGTLAARPPVAPLVRLLPAAVVDSPAVGRAISAAVTAVAVGAVVAVAAVVVDRRPVVDYGLDVDRDWWLDCGFGLALGAALQTLVFLVEYAAGWVVVRGTFRAAGRLGFAGAFAAALVLFLAVGVAEELLLRGYVLTNLAEAFRIFDERTAVTLAVLGSSALFGALHAANPNATAVSTAAVGLGGVLLALGYVLTGDLAVPVGLHVTWNLFQGPVYGFPVSGLDTGVSVLVVAQRGPQVATGGPFGPEAGLVGIGAMVAGGLAIAGYVRRRHGSLAPAPLAVPRLRWWRWGPPVDPAGDDGDGDGDGDADRPD